MKKTILFIVTSVLVVLVILILFLSFSIFPQQSLPPSKTLVQPTSIPLQNNTKNPASVEYNGQKSVELINKLKEKGQISESGQIAKQKLKDQLGSSSGTLFSSQNVSVGYLSSSDQFQSEIKSINISQAKQEAVDWMISQGFTKADVCNLPLSFYLNYSVSSQLKNSGILFNPLPDGC